MVDQSPIAQILDLALLTVEQYRRSEYGQLADAIPKMTQTIEWMQEYQAGLIDCLANGEGES